MSRKVGKNPTRHKFFCPNIVTIFIFKQSIINKQICTSPWSIILHDVIISPQKKSIFRHRIQFMQFDPKQLL